MGKGKLSSKKLSFVDAGNPYLSLDLPRLERWRLFRGDKKADARGHAYKIYVDNLTKEIIDLYFTENRDPNHIVAILSGRYGWPAPKEKERKELVSYVEKVVALKISRE